ncbi:pyridoxal-phosphate dependent enzyme family protein [Mycobacteroides abscessus subsp. bolletii 1513]|uniref:Pyridoxal-phosphate dependent enzyme family protein n=1 Tax=Mycobacteroides abscessus subsp. bolletii 1513 TaxID=1299321 RepID=X8DRS2_9MYCO|nr:pyridoxal-phosphate dependent enzyme family protein [Mycobacteroides abscessus subsp. bolletii 1513]
MRIAQHVSDLIGNTPLVRLNSVVPEGFATVAAKIEYLNPGGSSKDRIAVKMIEAAEEAGLLKPAAPSSSPPRAIPGSGSRWSRSARDTTACSCAPTRSARTNGMCCGPTGRGRRVPHGSSAGAPRQLLQRLGPSGA